ncbi:hypothetical protein JX265_003713 [Neoarthrinium moseri]|uniref:Uncharacterized protein n=1 Tax=Neoarthrinium moseri TaxID=1658444 RepID=A0A9P9WT93_9PEZI|nr:hypothetical protein JX265_003713 [Neoarthrinium moseri]
MNFWTPQLKLEFHRAVDELFRLGDTPCEERLYRGRLRVQNEFENEHTLNFDDELQIADNLAFLAQCEEGVRTVSAVTIQEHQDGMRVLIASNQTPSQDIVTGIRELLSYASEIATNAIHRDEFLEKAFQKVLDFSHSRILGRLRPPWQRPPAYIVGRPSSLLCQIRGLGQVLQGLVEVGSLPQSLLTNLDGLAEVLKPIDVKTDSIRMNEIIAEIIKSCVDISATGPGKSLEGALRSLAPSSNVCRRSEVRQIDKLARYYYACKDLLKMSRNPRYRSVFRTIEVQVIESFRGLRWPGAGNERFVHAEMLQVLHWERNGDQLRPRAIGCSKSACYLCNLFLQTQNVDWMSEEQAVSFRTVLGHMITTMQQEIDRHRGLGQQLFSPYVMQSRTFLPLSSASASTALSGVSIPSTVRGRHDEFNSSKLTVHEDRSSNTTARSPRRIKRDNFRLSRQDLPFRRCIQGDHLHFVVHFGHICLLFEFDEGMEGELCIRNKDSAAAETVEIQSIPTDRELALKSSAALPRSTFRLQDLSLGSLDIDFYPRTAQNHD